MVTVAVDAAGPCGGDRRHGGLEGGNDPAVAGVEVGGVGVRCRGDPLVPDVAPLAIDQVEPGEQGGDEVEAFARPGGRDGPLDRQRPQRACFDAVSVGMGCRGHVDGQRGDGGAVTEVGQGDRPGAHQRPVAGGVRVAFLIAGRGGPDGVAGSGGGAEHGAGLVADVARPAANPVEHRRVDAVQVGAAVGEDREQGEGHLGVVGPFTWFPSELPAAFQVARRRGVRTGELVGRPQGVANR